MKHGKIKTLEQLVKIRSRLRRQKKKVVFTNGCFDILHRGHIECLRKAKSLGDVLMVGINSNSSVRKVKGDKRPIISQSDRAEIISALEMVDYVLVFEEKTPEKIISALVPDVLVKGSDYRKEQIVGKDFVESCGGRVVRVKHIPGKSTRGIIQKIINRYGKSKITI